LVSGLVFAYLSRPINVKKVGEQIRVYIQAPASEDLDMFGTAG
jgi:hypothetical protein